MPRLLPLALIAVTACTGPAIGDATDAVDSDAGADSDTDRDTRPGEDLDGDGFSADEDCDDLDPDAYPGAPEILWNGRDEDCDGRIDADGRFEGTAAVSFQATVEGVTSRWRLSCPTRVDRVRTQVSFLIACEPPDGDALARQVMGESFTVRERSNVAEAELLSGDVIVESSDGWSVEGTGEVRFLSADDAEGAFSMRSVFARSSGSFQVSFVE